MREIYPRTGRAYLDRRHRSARRRQEHARRSPDDASSASARTDGRHRRRRSDEPVHRRRDPRRSRADAARTSATRACSSAAWPRAATSAGSRARPATSRSCSTPPARTSSSSRRSASARTRSTSSAPPTSRSSCWCPGTGDEVQALKAGIMEIADIFVVNKADREGADRARAVGRGDAVAADVRRRRLAAADREDRGDDRAPACPNCRGDRTVPRALGGGAGDAPARAAASTGCAICCRIASCSTSSEALPPGELQTHRRRHRRARARSVYGGRRDIMDRVAGRMSGNRADVILDHVGIAVQDIDKALRSTAMRSASRSRRPRRCASQRVRAHFIPVGRVVARTARGDRERFGRSRSTSRSAARASITSRCASTTSRAALARLKARGVRLVDDEPRPGAEGVARRLHPSVRGARRAGRAEAGWRPGPFGPGIGATRACSERRSGSSAGPASTTWPSVTDREEVNGDDAVRRAVGAVRARHAARQARRVPGAARRAGTACRRRS